MMHESTHVEPVTEQGLANVVTESPTPVVVDFWAAWCAPCRRLAPVIADVAAAMSDRLRFVSIDVDAEPALAERFGITSIPTITVLRGGRPVASLTGAVSREQLSSALEDWLQQTLEPASRPTPA